MKDAKAANEPLIDPETQAVLRRRPSPGTSGDMRTPSGMPDGARTR